MRLEFNPLGGNNSFRVILEGNECAVLSCEHEDQVIGVFTESFGEIDFNKAVCAHYCVELSRVAGYNNQYEKNGYVSFDVETTEATGLDDPQYNLNTVNIRIAHVFKPDPCPRVTGLTFTEARATVDNITKVDDNNGLLSCPESDDMPDNTNKDY